MNVNKRYLSLEHRKNLSFFSSLPKHLFLHLEQHEMHSLLMNLIRTQRSLIILIFSFWMLLEKKISG
jgi:hypothetical protein